MTKWSKFGKYSRYCFIGWYESETMSCTQRILLNKIEIYIVFLDNTVPSKDKEYQLSRIIYFRTKDKSKMIFKAWTVLAIDITIPITFSLPNSKCNKIFNAIQFQVSEDLKNISFLAFLSKLQAGSTQRCTYLALPPESTVES